MTHTVPVPEMISRVMRGCFRVSIIYAVLRAKFLWITMMFRPRSTGRGREHAWFPNEIQRAHDSVLLALKSICMDGIKSFDHISSIKSSKFKPMNDLYIVCAGIVFLWHSTATHLQHRGYCSCRGKYQRPNTSLIICLTPAAPFTCVFDPLNFPLTYFELLK